MSKKILFIADRPGWAFEFTIKGMRENLSEDEYEFETRYANDYKFINENHDNWDLIFSLGWRWPLPRDIRTPREKTISMFQSFRTLNGGSTNEWADYLNARYCAMGAVNPRLIELFEGKIEHMFYTPNAVDTKMFKQDYLAEEGKIVVGWAGRGGDVTFRGIDLIQEAVEECGYELKLLLADEKPFSHKQMPDFYHSLDCYINASISEGCSNVCLEAASCGLPLIATDTGSVPELVIPGETGFIIERTIPSIVAALKKLNRVQCRWMGTAMRDRIISEWSWSTVIEKHKALIDYGIEYGEEA